MNNPGGYTEANAWQYTLTPALHDPQGLVAQMSGAAAFEAWLDRFFSVQAPGVNQHLGQEALIGQYAHGNEPSHHIAYLYAWTASPHKGQALIRRIVHSFYGSGPDGIIGNDDCGQMSGWLVLSTLGLYPVVPASGTYVAGTTLVRHAGAGRWHAAHHRARPAPRRVAGRAAPWAQGAAACGGAAGAPAGSGSRTVNEGLRTLLGVALLAAVVLPSAATSTASAAGLPTSRPWARPPCG